MVVARFVDSSTAHTNLPRQNMVISDVELEIAHSQIHKDTDSLTHTDKETEKQTDRHRQTDRHTQTD